MRFSISTWAWRKKELRSDSLVGHLITLHLVNFQIGEPSLVFYRLVPNAARRPYAGGSCAFGILFFCGVRNVGVLHYVLEDLFIQSLVWVEEPNAIELHRRIPLVHVVFVVCSTEVDM